MKKEGKFQYSEEGYNKALQQQASYNFLGFTIYDIAHILLGIYFLIFYSINEPLNHFEIAECVVEIVVSVTLIAFIHAIAGAESGEAMNRTYTYAWLLASVSLLTPALFKGVSIRFTEFAPDDLIELIVIVFCIVMYALFFASLFAVKNRTLWMAFLYMGMLLFGVVTLLQFVELLLLGYPNEPIDIVNFWLLVVKFFVPVVPSVLGILGLYRVDRQINGKLL